MAKKRFIKTSPNSFELFWESETIMSFFATHGEANIHLSK